MADDHRRWDDDDRFYSSGRDSDDSPILSYRYDRQRRGSPAAAPACEPRGRRGAFTALAKCFLFSTAMIMFCVLMYIPVYNKANYQLPKGVVAGWSYDTNRDTKIYVQPNNVTTIHAPSDTCPKQNRKKRNKLFLLIVVCSATTNFENRAAIRDTWGNYTKYIHMAKVFNQVRDKYKNYNYTHDLYPDFDTKKNASKAKRDISGFSQLLPELAKALQNNVESTKEDVHEKRFDDEDDDKMLPEFDMNKITDDQSIEYEYYENNVMKIPPRGYEDNQDLEKLLKRLKKIKFPKIDEKVEVVDPEFKLVFLLGLPAHDNDSYIQSKIEEESNTHNDIIQENFIDSYNNLTLKSIMMLKWITNNCNESARYILKTDDDMYINVPNLMLSLRNRSKEFDRKVLDGHSGKEYLLIGDLICGARPVSDTNNKWYSPRYMYSGRVYPRYLSGTGYVMTSHTAHALYRAALTTHFFHLEDIYITGMCAARARPRQVPRDDPGFTYQAVTSDAAAATCAAHAHHSAHRVPPHRLRRLHARLALPAHLDRCERIRLTQVRRDRMKPKVPPKRAGKLGALH